MNKFLDGKISISRNCHPSVVPGQERFISMTRMYYKGAVACIVMFDVTSPSSFLSCRYWKQDLDNKAMLPNGASIPCILLANKVIRCIYPKYDTSGDHVGLALMNKHPPHV